MNVDEWVKVERSKAKKSSAKKAVEVIEGIVNEKGPGFLAGRVKMCEVDDGIAISWRKASTPRHLLLTVAHKGEDKGDYVILERGKDTFPRGTAMTLDKVYAVLDTELTGTVAAQQRALRRLMAGGNIEQTRISNEKAAAKARKKAEKLAAKEATKKKKKKAKK